MSKILKYSEFDKVSNVSSIQGSGYVSSYVIELKALRSTQNLHSPVCFLETKHMVKKINKRKNNKKLILLLIQYYVKIQIKISYVDALTLDQNLFKNQNNNVVMPQTSKKLREHIGFGLSVCPCVRLCIRSSKTVHARVLKFHI